MKLWRKNRLHLANNKKLQLRRTSKLQIRKKPFRDKIQKSCQLLSGWFHNRQHLRLKKHAASTWVLPWIRKYPQRILHRSKPQICLARQMKGLAIERILAQNKKLFKNSLQLKLTHSRSLVPSRSTRPHYSRTRIRQNWWADSTGVWSIARIWRMLHRPPTWYQKVWRTVVISTA